jgi:oligoribonuclease (3'-5' exoribonuclease)
MMINYTQDVMSYPKLELLFHYRKIAVAVLKAINVSVERTASRKEYTLFHYS